MAVLAARMLEPAGFGVFTFALGVALVGGRIAGLGLPMMMNRFIPGYVVKEDWQQMRGILRASYGIVAISAVGFGALCAAVAVILGPESDLYLGLLFGALLLPIMSFRSLYRNLLASLKIPQKGIMVDEFLPAAIMTFALLILLSTEITPLWAILIYILASTIAVAAGYVWVRSKLPPQVPTAKPNYAIRLWMMTALPAVVGMSAKLLMNKTDVLMLAPLGTMTDVGIYGAAMRATYPQVVAVIVLSTVITARISEAFSAGKDRQGRKLFYGALIFALFCAVPFALILARYDNEVMGFLFGEAYAGGGSVLTYLAIAQVAAAVNIPATSFMLMTGRQAAFGKMTLFALLINIVGNYILIPQSGAAGAALATCISIYALAAMQLVSCHLIIKSGRYTEVKP